MAKQTINIGSAPNDGTGDVLRVAFDKTNDNFTELYEEGGANITVNNPVTLTETDLDTALADLVGGGTTPDLEAVLTEGDESTTQDAIFRLDADKYLKINRADQSFEVWDLSVDADEPMSYVKGNIVKIGNSSTDYTISLDGDGGSISILDNGTADETFFTRAVINKNGINYQYPDGETSMLAKTAIS